MEEIYLNDDCYENYNLITNFDKEEEPIYRKAIQLYGWRGLYITKDSYWLNGYKDDKLLALRCTQRRDLTEFWDIFYKIKCE